MRSETRILVVDDEKLIRWSLSERLARNGHQVSAAESGEQALQSIAASHPDIMLLDVRMPGIDGLETLKRALVLQPELMVLMMSAHASVDIAVEGMKHGAVDFLVKPFELAAMEAAVKRALDALATRRVIALPVCQKRAEGCCTAGGACIVGVSAAMEEMRGMVQRVAASESATVLIEGESGVGKEVVARCIHAQSARGAGPFLTINCAAMPDQLLESELFGHERGSFTDARTQKIGIFEAARRGTVMLDEIAELPAAGQAKLLRLLESRTLRRVGGVQEIATDVRVIAATNADLEKQVADNRFRADLYFRLNVVRIRIPPLRERPEDIPSLAGHFITRYGQQMKSGLRGVTPAALEQLMRYRWPGNVRELRNVIERAFVLHAGAEELKPEHLPSAIAGQPAANDSAASAQASPAVLQLGAMERRMIVEALRNSEGNQSAAARVLGVTRDTLRYRLKKHALE